MALTPAHCGTRGGSARRVVSPLVLVLVQPSQGVENCVGLYEAQTPACLTVDNGDVELDLQWRTAFNTGRRHLRRGRIAVV